MNEHEKQYEDSNENEVYDDALDLGSEPSGETEFDPFADDELSDAIEKDEAESKKPAPKPEKPAQSSITTAKPASEKKETSSNPFETAINAAENQDAEKAQKSLFEKLPVFEYAGATENVDDLSKTFEDLRIDKAEDFPELDDGKRVSWTVEYGKISKPVAKPKEISIGKMKSEIETSKEFLEALKKSKEKDPVCRLKPRVTAQSKGKISAYKGIFTSTEEAEVSGKVISIVPARDGRVYEIRNTEMGRFVTPINGSDMLSEVKAGFIPALPLISTDIVMGVISFFRSFMANGAELEALVNIYWDKINEEFVIHAPKQTVSKASIESELGNEYSDERYIHYMDIHSHNSMKAFFSTIDDRDERATRIYAVIGRLDNYFPDIRVRISNGGKFHEIPVNQVFEAIGGYFPDEWTENVNFRESPHGEDAPSIASMRKELLGGMGDYL